MPQPARLVLTPLPVENKPRAFVSTKSTAMVCDTFSHADILAANFRHDREWGDTTKLGHHKCVSFPPYIPCPELDKNLPNSALDKIVHDNLATLFNENGVYCKLQSLADI